VIYDFNNSGATVNLTISITAKAFNCIEEVKIEVMLVLTEPLNLESTKEQICKNVYYTRRFPENEVQVTHKRLPFMYHLK